MPGLFTCYSTSEGTSFTLSELTCLRSLHTLSVIENPKRKIWYEIYTAWVEMVREPMNSFTCHHAFLYQMKWRGRLYPKYRI